MANSQGICTSFKTELMQGYHCFTAGIRAADTVKAALYLASATTGVSNTVYTTTGEVSGTGYTAGGINVTAGTATATGTTAFWQPGGQIQWTTVTLATAFDCVMLYNSTQANRAIATFTFGSQTVTAGNFTLTMPTNDSANALIRLA